FCDYHTSSAFWYLQVLVGIGSRSMRIIKLKSLKLYAFGLCNAFEKSLRTRLQKVVFTFTELSGKFFVGYSFKPYHTDLIALSLPKMNPDTDYHCLRVFGSYFTQDIALPAVRLHFLCLYLVFLLLKLMKQMLFQGTTIDFRQTANGQLITESEWCEHCLCAVGGRQVGAVHSKDLCRAFFDMYIGDVPVSLQAKEEVAENVAGLIRRC
ncbi:hypothetical protein B296_00021083, partial [Ensete ventricosum]